MKKHWQLILIIFILSIFTYFVFPIIKNRYFRSDPKTIELSPKNEESQDGFFSNQKNYSNSGDNTAESLNITVTRTDCDNECSRFKKDDEVEYCEQVCGISDLYDYGDDEEESDTDEEGSTDCSKKAGLKKDYCLKDQAIQNSSFGTCEEISDSQIKKTCLSRITEDLLEEEARQN